MTHLSQLFRRWVNLMPYTKYQVVLVAEDGEYVLYECQTENKAIDLAEKEQENYGDGQRLEIRQFVGGF